MTKDRVLVKGLKLMKVIIMKNNERVDFACKLFFSGLFFKLIWIGLPTS